MRAGKSFVRMQHRLLREWFHVCKVIASSVAGICERAKGEGHELTRPEIFRELLDDLGFGQQEKEDLCRSVERFYEELYV